MLPYIELLRAETDLKEEMAVLVKDGEYEQTQMYFDDPELLLKLEKAKIDVREKIQIQFNDACCVCVGDKNLCFWISCFFTL